MSWQASSSRVNGSSAMRRAALAALELGDDRPQRMAAVQLVAAVGADHEDVLAAQRAGEEDEEVARRAVGPVEVLDDEDGGVVAAEAVEQGEQRLEEPRLRGDLADVGGRRLRAAELGQELGEVVAAGAEGVEDGVAGAHERAQRGDDRRVGQLAGAELDALAEEDARAAVRGARRELVDEAGLAHARLAGDEGEVGDPAPRLLQQVRQLGELRLTADEPVAGHACGHMRSIRAHAAGRRILWRRPRRSRAGRAGRRARRGGGRGVAAPRPCGRSRACGP